MKELYLLIALTSMAGAIYLILKLTVFKEEENKWKKQRRK